MMATTCKIVLMQPDQPNPAPSNPYDFILNNGQQSKKPGVAGAQGSGGGSMKKRILVVLMGLITLVLLFLVFSYIASSASRSGTQDLVNLAAEQTELIRIADTGFTSASSNSSLNFAATTSVSLKTNQQSVKTLISRHGHVLTLKELGGKKDSRVDAQLATAKLNNQYDSTFNKILLSNLLSYQKSVKMLHDASTNASEKQTLSNLYDAVSLIINSQ